MSNPSRTPSGPDVQMVASSTSIVFGLIIFSSTPYAPSGKKTSSLLGYSFFIAKAGEGFFESSCAVHEDLLLSV